jgi:hypothetical protein
MKQVQNLLLAALVAVLALIAYDLHRLTMFFTPSPPLKTVLGLQAPPPPETREQRNVRLRREVQELTEDFKAMLEDPKPAPRKAAPSPGQSAR